MTTLSLKIPRESEVTPEAAQTFLSALTQINSVTSFDKLRGKRSQALSLEIILHQQKIRFAITCDADLVPFVEAQLQSNYPLVIIEKIEDPLLEFETLEASELTLRKGNYHPINTYPAFQDIDPMSSILSVLSKSLPEEFAMIQISLESISGAWQGQGQGYAETGGGKKVSETGVVTFLPHPDANMIKEKISYPGFAVSFRVAASNKQTKNELVSSFGVYARADGNSFTSKKRSFWARTKPMTELKLRLVTDKQVLNIQELASIWHLPGDKIKTASVIWGTKVLSESPDNLPAAMDMTDEEKKKVNFFAKTHYKNTEATFGIKDRDRRRHVWVIGKTGTGKSTLIANMVIDDLKKGRGVGVIDPHGDLCETVLDYIPKSRINETIYFNPSDREHPIVINPLEVTSKEEAELVVSGLMSIFTKIWANVWSARMEYIMRNALMTLTEIPEATLEDVLKLLADNSYRNSIVQRISDDALKQFWLMEYNKMPDRLQKEAIAPIQNKVGQFVTSPMIRRIIGHPKSTVSVRDAMDNGMIFLANLSQGRLGEDNSALLGATLITKFQLSAMHRVDIPEDDRKDYHLYVDEFQNFATTSFIKILSEARKYRLNLMLANQYMAQIPEEVTKAILGNVGSLVSFGVGADDAEVIHKEYAEVFSQNDLVNLANFQVAVKLMVDGRSTRPFLAHTLPLPASKNQNKTRVLQVSRDKWSRKYEHKPVSPAPVPPANAQPPAQAANRPPHKFQPRPRAHTPNNRPLHTHKPQSGTLYTSQNPNKK